MSHPGFSFTLTHSAFKDSDCTGLTQKQFMNYTSDAAPRRLKSVRSYKTENGGGISDGVNGLEKNLKRQAERDGK